MTDRAESQFYNVLPPRRGEILALAITATAQAFDFTSLTMKGVVPNQIRSEDYVRVTLEADGGDVFYQFAPDTTIVSLSPAATFSAGVISAYNAAHGAKLASGSLLVHRINRYQDRILIACTSTGTATLRLFSSSQA